MIPHSRSISLPLVLKCFRNKQIELFKKGKLLGQGGQGTVYAGTYEGLVCAGKTFSGSPDKALLDECANEVSRQPHGPKRVRTMKGNVQHLSVMRFGGGIRAFRTQAPLICPESRRLPRGPELVRGRFLLPQ